MLKTVLPVSFCNAFTVYQWSAKACHTNMRTTVWFQEQWTLFWKTSHFFVAAVTRSRSLHTGPVVWIQPRWWLCLSGDLCDQSSWFGPVPGGKIPSCWNDRSVWSRRSHGWSAGVTAETRRWRWHEVLGDTHGKRLWRCCGGSVRLALEHRWVIGLLESERLKGEACSLVPGSALSVQGFSVRVIPAVSEIPVECHSREEITEARVLVSENEANLPLELPHFRRDATTQRVVKGDIPAWRSLVWAVEELILTHLFGLALKSMNQVTLVERLIRGRDFTVSSKVSPCLSFNSCRLRIWTQEILQALGLGCVSTPSWILWAPPAATLAWLGISRSALDP